MVLAGSIVIAWQLPFYIYRCSEEFMLKNICGTFLEVHRPFDKEILTSLELKKFDLINNFWIETFPASSLCAGKYEVSLFKTI